MDLEHFERKPHFPKNERLPKGYKEVEEVSSKVIKVEMDSKHFERKPGLSEIERLRKSYKEEEEISSKVLKVEMDSKHFERKPHLSKIERLPKSYKEVEKVLKNVKACKGNLKTVLNNSRLRGGVFKKVYALAANVLKHRHILDRIIQETELLKKETFLREDLAEILIYELVYGKGLPGESRPVTIVKQYEDSIHNAYKVALKEDNLTVKGLQSLPRYARVNTLLTTVPDVMKSLRKAEYRETYYGENTSEKEYLDLVRNLEPGNFLIDYHFKDLLVFASNENLTTWSLYQKKHVFIQDKSSYIPVYALDPKPGNVVIDACAAPGMKTIHIAAAMENNGKIYASEKSEDRFQILKDMVDNAGVQICEAECVDFYLVNANDPKFNDLECILVDPSCSGSGMVNRMDTVTDTEDSKNIFRLKKLAGFQILLLKHALSFPSVKRVVYSTCSISEEENEYVVHEVLNHYYHTFKLVSVMPNWTTRGSESFKFGKLCLRAHPEETLTNGFFVAMFERMSYDEMLEVSRPLSDKSSKKKRKRKDNLERRDSDINSMGYNASEQQDNPRFSNDSSSVKKKECTAERYFNQVDDENEDESAHLENYKVIKNEHSDEKLSKKRKRNETSFAENDVDLPHSNLDGNSRFPVDSCFTSSSKKKKKKHKKEKSYSDVDAETDVTKNNIEEKTILENGLVRTESEIKTKQHKHKKHSKEKAEICDNLEYIGKTGLSEGEIASEVKDATPKKKHKKKHIKKDFEVVDLSPEMSQNLVRVSKKSLCHDENTEVSEPYDEKCNKIGHDIEDNSLTKKHKKKCKYKRSKEE